MPDPIYTASIVQRLITGVRREVETLEWGDEPRPRSGWQDLDALLRLADKEIARIIRMEGEPAVPDTAICRECGGRGETPHSGSGVPDICPGCRGGGVVTSSRKEGGV